MLGLAFAPNFWMILLSVVFIGLGSAVFHPEGSRVAYLAAGTKRGLSQSIYQVGGNAGQALAPLITALILVPLGQFGAIWFTLVAALAVIFLSYIAKWYAQQIKVFKRRRKYKLKENRAKKSPKQLNGPLLFLSLLPLHAHGTARQSLISMHFTSWIITD